MAWQPDGTKNVQANVLDLAGCVDALTEENATQHDAIHHTVGMVEANHVWTRDTVEAVKREHRRNWWALWFCVQIQFLIAIWVGASC